MIYILFKKFYLFCFRIQCKNESYFLSMAMFLFSFINTVSPYMIFHVFYTNDILALKRKRFTITVSYVSFKQDYLKISPFTIIFVLLKTKRKKISMYIIPLMSEVSLKSMRSLSTEPRIQCQLVCSQGSLKKCAKFINCTKNPTPIGMFARLFV